MTDELLMQEVRDGDIAKLGVLFDRHHHGVFGTVNGGGPDIELRTWNGAVYLRKGN